MQIMALILIGSHHRLTPPSRLQQVLGAKESIFAQLLAMQKSGKITGAFLLATCNRLEVLLDTENGSSEQDRQALADEILPPHSCSDIKYHLLHGQEATTHLLRVATGLESMVPGEDQILGQLREALKMAERHNLLSKKLGILRTRLMGAARDIRRRTGMTRVQVSVAATAAKLLQRAGSQLCVVGAGETGRLAVETLTRRGVKNILIVNRTLKSAQALAQHFGHQAMSLREFLEIRRGPAPMPLQGILFAVHSSEPIFTAAHAEGIDLAVDISMPSVLHPDLNDKPGTEIIDLDALAKHVEAEGERRGSSLKIAEELAHSRAQRIHAEILGKHKDFASIIDQHLNTALSELENALKSKLQHLSGDDQERVRQVVLRTTRRNAHYHLQDLKQLPST